ncbi:MAG: SEC-C metal-binding domain-containing protein, partial [Exilibacterium sp.]
MNTETTVTDQHNSSEHSADEARTLADSESSVAAARERLKSGRNEPCPCGSGRKYKKCCLQADEELARQATAASPLPSKSIAEALPGPLALKNSDASGSDGTAPRRQTRELSETERRLNELWDWFDSLAQPSAEQMDEWLQGLFALPPELTQWNDVIYTCTNKGYPDLPKVFRQIAAHVPHTRETQMSSFYWAAIEEFTRTDLHTLLPEVVAGFMKLDKHSYDVEALWHVENILLAGHFETEALALAEYFLPIVRNDGELMPSAVMEQCNLSFQLRTGMALRGGPEAATSPQAVAQALHRDLEEDIHQEAVDSAARVICETGAPDWTRASFDLVKGDIRESEQAWQDCLGLYDTLMRVAREAWHIDGVAPGRSFVGLSRLLESVYRAQSRDKAKRKGNKKRRTAGTILLDYLTPVDMEQRFVRACPVILGLDIPQARVLLDAYTLLLDFADRQRL